MTLQNKKINDDNMEDIDECKFFEDFVNETQKELRIDLKKSTAKLKNESAFEQLSKTVISDRDKIELYKVKDGLGISDDDSLWIIFLALQHHLLLYRQIPGEIEAATQNVIDKVHQPINSAQKTGVNKIKKEVREQKTVLHNYVVNQIKKSNINAKDNLNKLSNKIVEVVQKSVEDVVIRPWAKVWQSVLQLIFLFLGVVVGGVVLLLKPDLYIFLRSLL